MPQFRRMLAWVTVAASLAFSSHAIAQVRTEDQSRYLQAIAAFERKDLPTFETLKASLRDYPLHPYLEYRSLSGRLGDTAAVEAFVATQASTYLGDRLRGAWLRQLGKEGRTDLILKHYRPDQDEDSASLRCLALHARLQSHAAAARLLEEAQQHWLSDRNLPESCDLLAQDLERAGQLTPELVWSRIRLVMKRNNLGLARALAAKLPESQRELIKSWQKAHDQPASALSEGMSWPDTARHRDILVHALKRHARGDTLAAWDLWQQQIRPNFRFTPDQIGEVEEALALRAAYRHLPEAGQMFAGVAESALSPESRAWRIRSALRNLDWSRAQGYLEALPADERDALQWRYWRARATEALGRSDDAKTLYASLAGETDYYGFLAAERLKRPYTFNNLAIVKHGEAKAAAALAERPALRRIRELYSLGLETEAYAELNYELKHTLNADEKRYAARLVHDWGWHFAAIISAGRARHFSDLGLRFPMLFSEQVHRAAEAQALPASWVYGVIRRESAFRTTARSSAGALGLMQLMPATAQQVSKQIGLGKLDRNAILHPETNLALGTRYLRGVFERFNHEALATASYNAGPGRVQQWLPRTTELPADIWIDTIVFDETRDYVKAVLFYSTIFDWKLNDGVVRSLGSRMPPVKPVEGVQVAVIEEREEAEASTEN
ncbi:MAG: transglycosylase SLT domain-containing protein [Thiotrichales bacterium]